MKNIKHAILSYNASEFIPIYYGGKLDNLDQFVLYKAKCALKHFVPLVDKIDKLIVGEAK